MVDINFSFAKEQMVREQIFNRGIKDDAVLAAMKSVPRHRFVPETYLHQAYSDSPLPIDEGQTISQPYIVALMTESAQLNHTSKVLEIGTGSGYAAAILSKIAQEVHTIERLPRLANQAKILLEELGYNNVHVHTGDGTLGLVNQAPFDAIIVTAGAPVIPESFLDQLKVGGRIIIPVGDAAAQQLIRLTKTESQNYQKEIILPVRFVPLIGKQGWSDLH